LGRTNPNKKQVWKALGDQRSGEKVVSDVESDQHVIEDYSKSSDSSESSSPR
ncbi:hypothetical protein KI387_029192, partial [Taxus chinensis]